jgi:hypothetical protein
VLVSWSSAALESARAIPKSATSACAGQQDVLRLDVAMNDAVGVRVPEGVGGLRGDAERVGERKLLLAVQPVAKRLPLDERHGEPEIAVGLAAVVHRQDVGMLEPSGETDLALEALGAEGVPEVRMQHLEGDGPVVAEIVRQVDGRHAAVTELAVDGVALGEACSELGP